MSFIIQGIDMPKDDKPIFIEVYSDGRVWEDQGREWRAYPKGTAIQIPKGHGRIGDLGKLAKLISEYGESLKESVRGNRLLMTERDLCHAIAVLIEHFQEYEPLLEAEE